MKSCGRPKPEADDIHVNDARTDDGGGVSADVTVRCERAAKVIYRATVQCRHRRGECFYVRSEFRKPRPSRPEEISLQAESKGHAMLVHCDRQAIFGAGGARPATNGRGTPFTWMCIQTTINFCGTTRYVGNCQVGTCHLFAKRQIRVFTFLRRGSAYLFEVGASWL